MSAVHYRLKSVTEYQTIRFVGDCIPLKDFKNSVIEKNTTQSRSGGFDILVTNEDSGLIYDDKNFLIPKNTRLLISRIPIYVNNDRPSTFTRHYSIQAKSKVPLSVETKKDDPPKKHVKIVYSMDLSTKENENSNHKKFEEDLFCPVCHGLSVNAFILSCCSESVCGTCVNSMCEGEGKCKLCGVKVVKTTCIPNTFLRKSVEAYKPPQIVKENVKKGSDYLLKNGVCFPQKCGVNPTVSLASPMVFGYRPMGPCLLDEIDIIKLKAEFADTSKRSYGGSDSASKRSRR